MPFLGTHKHQRSAATSSEPHQRHFRLNEDEIDELTEEFHVWRSRGNGGKALAASRKWILIFLDYMSSGGFFRAIGRAHGVAESTSREACHSVAEFLMSVAEQYIKLPTPDEFANLAEEVNGKRAILYIDGSIIAIQRPDHAGDAYFCGRHGKSRDSLNTQFVCDKFGRIRHVFFENPNFFCNLFLDLSH